MPAEFFVSTERAVAGNRLVTPKTHSVCIICIRNILRNLSLTVKRRSIFPPSLFKSDAFISHSTHLTGISIGLSSTQLQTSGLHPLSWNIPRKQARLVSLWYQPVSKQGNMSASNDSTLSRQWVGADGQAYPSKAAVLRAGTTVAQNPLQTSRRAPKNTRGSRDGRGRGAKANAQRKSTTAKVKTTVASGSIVAQPPAARPDASGPSTTAVKNDGSPDNRLTVRPKSSKRPKRVDGQSIVQFSGETGNPSPVVSQNESVRIVFKDWASEAAAGIVQPREVVRFYTHRDRRGRDFFYLGNGTTVYNEVPPGVRVIEQPRHYLASPGGTAPTYNYGSKDDRVRRRRRGGVRSVRKGKYVMYVFGDNENPPARPRETVASKSGVTFEVNPPPAGLRLSSVVRFYTTEEEGSRASWYISDKDQIYDQPPGGSYGNLITIYSQPPSPAVILRPYRPTAGRTPPVLGRPDPPVSRPPPVKASAENTTASSAVSSSKTSAPAEDSTVSDAPPAPSTGTPASCPPPVEHPPESTNDSSAVDTKTLAPPEDTTMSDAPPAPQTKTPGNVAAPAQRFWIPQRQGRDGQVFFVSTVNLEERTEECPHASQLRFGITEQSANPLPNTVEAKGTLAKFYTAAPDPVLYYIDEESRVYHALPQSIILEEDALVPSHVRLMDGRTAVSFGMYDEFGRGLLVDIWYIDKECRLWGGWRPGMVKITWRTAWPANYRMIEQEEWPAEEAPHDLGDPGNQPGFGSGSQKMAAPPSLTTQQPKQPIREQSTPKDSVHQQPVQQQPVQQYQPVPQNQPVQPQQPVRPQPRSSLGPFLQPPPARLDTIAPGLREFLTVPLTPGESVDPNTATSNQVDDLIRRTRTDARIVDGALGPRTGFDVIWGRALDGREKCDLYERSYCRGENDARLFGDGEFVAQQRRLWAEEKRRLYNPPGGP